MSILEQKHHGVPARGIQGLDGKQGKKGQSVYIGFINDFFDYTEYDIDPAVRYTKRKVDNLSNTESWRNYQSVYNTINVDTMYYTGEFTPIDSGIKDSEQNAIMRDMDVVSYNEKMPGESLINPDNGQEPIESYEFKFVKDIAYENALGKQLQYVDVYDFVDPDDNIDNVLLNEYDPIPEYTVHIDVNHITYDYSDLKRIALMKFKAMGEAAPYDMWDFFTTHDEYGNQIEDKQTPETYKAWLDDPDRFPLFVREKLAGAYTEYRTGVTSYYGIEATWYDSLNMPFTGYKAWPYEGTGNPHYLIMPDDDTPAIEDLTYALLYFKHPVKTYPLYSYNSELSVSDIMQDNEGFIYIGINDDTLYKVSDDGKITLQDTNDILINIRKTDEDTPLIDLTNFTLSDYTPFISAIRDYTVTLSNNSAKDLLPKDDLVVWHSGTGKLKLPTTLSESINVGDIIYFYTNIGQYNQIDNNSTLRHIEYMAIVTEDMLGCSVEDLIQKALVVKPFDYSVFNNEYDAERAEINRSTIITHINRNMPVDYDDQGLEHFNIKSIEEILTHDEHCALRLISANYFDNYKSAALLQCIARDYNSFANSKYVDNTLTLTSTRVGDTRNIIKTSDNILAIDSLLVNESDYNLNFELTNMVYDPNIIFDSNGNFIYESINTGNIKYERSLDEKIGIRHKHTFSYNIDKNSLLHNNDTANQYAVGYIIKDNTNKVINSESLYQNNITWYINLDTTSDCIDLFETDAENNPDEQYTYYDIITTIKKNTGMMYFSNITRLYVYIDSTVKANQEYDIIRYDTEVLYPVYIEDDGISTGNNHIQFTLSDIISCEDFTGKYNQPLELAITADSSDIIILSVSVNNQLINKKSISNSWITITNMSDFRYKLAITDNIPDISYNDIVYNTICIDDYMVTLADIEGENSTSPLFRYFLNKNRFPSSSDRFVTLSVTYTYKETINNKVFENTYKESYVINQPGFTDPRCLPELNMKLVNDYQQLSEINTIEHGVLCNQFRTYLDIISSNIDISSWLMYNNNVTVDFSIELDNTDDDITSTSILANKQYPTLKIALDENSTFNKAQNNYYSLNCKLLNDDLSSYLTISDNTTYTGFKFTNNALENYIYNTQDTLYSILTSINPVVNPNGIPFSSQTHGVYHTFKINCQNIPAQLLNQGIRLQIDFEWGNPMISSLYLKFKISNIKIHYASNNGDKTFNIIMDNTSVVQSKTDSLCVNINPISLIACDPDGNNYTGLDYKNTVKINIPDQADGLINFCSDFYNKGIYTKYPIALKNKKYKAQYITPGKYIFNDDVQNIDIQLISPKDVLAYINKPDYYETTDTIIVDTDMLQQSAVHKDLLNKLGLSVFYNANLFNPRYRNDKETFYVNNQEYEADRYRLVKINDNEELILSPILFYPESSITLRTDEYMNAIDTWNFEYQVKVPDDKKVKTYMQGSKSTYGQGAYYLYKSDYASEYETDNPYADDEIPNLSDIFNASLGAEETSITTDTYSQVEELEHSMTKANMFPDNNGLFRILASFMKWEYLYEIDEDNIGHATMISPFEGLLLSQLNVGKWSTSYDILKKKLMQSSDTFIPYNLCYNLSVRLGMQPELPNVFNYLMLRMPVINEDNTDINDVKETEPSQFDSTNYLDLHYNSDDSSILTKAYYYNKNYTTENYS